jgi:hypothetical protein
MTVTSKREDILEYLLDTVSHLPDGTGFYNLDIKSRARMYKDISTMKDHEFPALFILDDTSTQYNPMTNCGYTTGTTIQGVTDGMPVNVVGVVKINRRNDPDSLGRLSTELNKIFSDIIIAMSRDLRQGGNCEASVLVGDNRTVEVDESHGYGLVICTYMIKYDFNPRATTPIT